METSQCRKKRRTYKRKSMRRKSVRRKSMRHKSARRKSMRGKSMRHKSRVRRSKRRLYLGGADSLSGGADAPQIAAPGLNFLGDATALAMQDQDFSPQFKNLLDAAHSVSVAEWEKAREEEAVMGIELLGGAAAAEDLQLEDLADAAVAAIDFITQGSGVADVGVVGGAVGARGGAAGGGGDGGARGGAPGAGASVLSTKRHGKAGPLGAWYLVILYYIATEKGGEQRKIKHRVRADGLGQLIIEKQSKEEIATLLGYVMTEYNALVLMKSPPENLDRKREMWNQAARKLRGNSAAAEAATKRAKPNYTQAGKSWIDESQGGGSIGPGMPTYTEIMEGQWVGLYGQVDDKAAEARDGCLEADQLKKIIDKYLYLLI